MSVHPTYFDLATPLCPTARSSSRWRAYVLLLFLIFYNTYFLAISVKSIISKSAGPIFAKFSGLVELRL